MVRVNGAREVLLVAAHAIRRCIAEIPGRMALIAILYGMPLRQREEVMHHVVRVPAVAHGIMALDAIRGIPRTSMIRGLRGHIVVLVAADAIVADPVESQWIAGGMAVRAAQAAMRTSQCESILLMQLGHGVHDPIHRGMASHAIVANGHGMHIGMARHALHRSRVEDQGGVAGAAIDFGVRAFEREPRGIMLEHHCGSAGIHERLLTASAAAMLERAGLALGPDQRRIRPACGAVAFTAVEAQLLPVR